MVQADPSGRVVQFPSAVVNILEGVSSAQQPVALVLDNIPLEQFYILQKEVQEEIHFHE